MPAHASRWDALVWARWLPVQARMPLIAQITGAVALTALLAAPWWATIPEPSPVLEPSAVAPRPTVAPLAPAVPESPAVARAIPANPDGAARPAHLNLDVRHSFGSVDFSVTVDGKPAIATKLAGSGKRFKVFGQRSERGYTRTLDLEPGVRVVRVRILSIADKFDQTRVERFELGSASVATLRVAADKSGLSLVAERPSAPAQTPVHAVVPRQTPPPEVLPAAAAAIPVSAPAAPATHDANAVVDLLQSMRSILIAIAGFVASAATGVVIEDYLRTRRQRFQAAGATDHGMPNVEPRRRRRRGRAGIPRDDNGPGDDSDSGVPARNRSSIIPE